MVCTEIIFVDFTSCVIMLFILCHITNSVARDLLGIKQFEEQAQEKGKLNHASLQVKEITGIVVGILILIGIVAGIFLGYRRWTRKEDIFSADEFDYFFTGSANQEDNIESSAYKKELWEIPEHFFEMGMFV